MNPFELTVRWSRGLAFFAGMAASLALVGCGSAEDAMNEEYEGMPSMTPAAQLEFRIDSLMNENRKMRDQVEAMTTENRRLTARNAELETKVNELTAAAAQPRPAPAPTPAPVTDVSSAYKEALNQFYGRNYGEAITQFQAILNSGSAGSLADNCQYWIGESYFGMRKYNEALQAFHGVLEYTRSGKIPYAYLMIGNSESALGNKSAARDAYAKVVSDFPASPAAGTAQAKLARLK
jgi:tol-pal system protein YbgF